MIGFLIRIGVGALGLWLASVIVPGVEIRDTGTLILAALLLGVVNAIVRPVLVILSLPFLILTLGLFLVILNAVLIWGVATILPGFVLHGFKAALLTAIVTGAVSWVAGGFIGGEARIERIRRRG